MKASAMQKTLLVFAITAFGGCSLPAKSACLEIALAVKSDRLTLSGGGASARPNRSAAAIARDFRTLYLALEENKKLAGTPEALIAKLSDELLKPLSPEIGSASCVVFQIRPDQMYFALDLLSVGGSPLFVQKPIGYAFKANTDFGEQVVRPGAKGLIIRDPSTDPQDGAKTAHGMFPESKLYFMKETSLRIFRGSKFDFILISGHGSVFMPWDDSDDREEDTIEFNDDSITADVLAKSRHKLVYLDSCQLGMSESFINAARKAGARYYLAPIISNEAGNSSTKTIRYFFGALKEGQPPIDALFAARKKLYSEFQGKVSREKLLYYAFPFRIYGL